MVVKTFRGMLADPGQDRIRLSTIKGKVGYRIVKFQLFAETPGSTSYEHVVKIYIDEQSSATGIVNFTDSTLLASAFLQGHSDSTTTEAVLVIFDKEIFNQDIYITHIDADGALNCNYYLELEIIPLDDAGAEYTTLKDMRSA